MGMAKMERQGQRVREENFKKEIGARSEIGSA
jgi:hypothetical protein